MSRIRKRESTPERVQGLHPQGSGQINDKIETTNVDDLEFRRPRYWDGGSGIGSRTGWPAGEAKAGWCDQMANTGSTREVVVTVTDDHIRRGLRRNCKQCPVALALIDAGFRDVSAGCESFTYECNPILRIMILLRSHVSQRIHKYDETGKMEPFTFTVGR